MDDISPSVRILALSYLFSVISGDNVDDSDDIMLSKLSDVANEAEKRGWFGDVLKVSGQYNTVLRY
jgi:hypothetical protein